MTGGVAGGALKVMSVFSKKATEPVRSSVFVKGDRMANVSASQIQVFDLGKETITEINLEKKTYSVITFAEMRQAMEKMQRALSGKKDQGAEINFKVDIKDTGQKKQINGLETGQLILTLEMQSRDPESGSEGTLTLVSEMWMAPNVPGYDEVRRFQVKMAQKMAWSPGNLGMFQQNSKMASALAGLEKEAAKLDGVPVVQVTKIGAAGQPGQSPSEPQASKPEESTRPSIGGAIGRLGGFGGFGRRKKQQEPEQRAPQSSPGSLMETTTESSGFSTASIDASRFEVPAGYRQVESELIKELRK